jgi:hypothetical protein
MLLLLLLLLLLLKFVATDVEIDTEIDTDIDKNAFWLLLIELLLILNAVVADICVVMKNVCLTCTHLYCAIQNLENMKAIIDLEFFTWLIFNCIHFSSSSSFSDDTNFAKAK